MKTLRSSAWAYYIIAFAFYEDAHLLFSERDWTCYAPVLIFQGVRRRNESYEQYF